MNREEIVAALETALAAEPPSLTTAYLFGSVARNEARASSDVDVGLLYRTDPPHRLDAPPFDVQIRLADALGIEVDVIVLNRASLDLAHRVLRDGVLLLERDRQHRIEFEMRVRREYLDLLPYLRRYRGYERQVG